MMSVPQALPIFPLRAFAQKQEIIVNPRLAFLLLAIGPVSLCAPAHAQSSNMSVLVLPDQVSFKGPLSGAPQTAVLFGDPKNQGLFVQRTKFAPGMKVMPHTHPDQPR